MIRTEATRRYRLLEEYRGAHRSRVFRVLDRADGSERIAKFVPRSLVSLPDVLSLRTDFRTLSLLRHPNLVRVFDFGEDAEWIWMISEKIDGVPISEAAKPESARLREWAEVLLGVLAYLHDRGIIHHDIKPSNVLIGPEGDPRTVRLIDLGLSARRYLRRAGEGPRGTPGYLAPELLAPGEVDFRVDLYALGVLCRELAGERVEPSFGRWLGRMTDPNPENRFAGARAARSALCAGEAGETVLEPYLLDSLPWVQCRAAWKALLSSSRPTAVQGDPAELLRFASALRGHLLAAGVELKEVSRSDEVDHTWPTRDAGAAVMIRGGIEQAGGMNIALWAEDLRARSTARIVWFGVPGTRPSPEGWAQLSLGPYSPEEVRALIEPLHPELFLEEALLTTLFGATQGSPSALRSILGRILAGRPTPEQFRQRLGAGLLTGGFVRGRRGPSVPSADPRLRVLAWAGGPLPLSWFSSFVEQLAEWARKGWIRYFVKDGEALVETAADWRAKRLTRADREWLRERLGGVPQNATGRDLERFTPIALRAGFPELALRFGSRLLAQLLRRRLHETALAWLDLLLPAAHGAQRERFERTRVRLFLELRRLSDAGPPIRSMPLSAARKRLEERLAFLEGRFADCPPSPDVLLRTGREGEAYERTAAKLWEAGLPPSRRADLERICGLAAMFRGNIETAVGHLKRSLALWKKAGRPDRYVPALNQLGVVFARAGDRKRAARCYRYAALLAARTGDRRNSMSYLLNLATVQLESGDAAKAVANFERCRNAFRLLGLAAEEVSATHNLANFWLRMGAADRAARLLSEARSRLGELSEEQAATYQRILEANLFLARSQKERFLEQCRGFEGREVPPRFASAVATLEAEARFLRGDFPAAAERLEKSGADPAHVALLLSEWEAAGGNARPAVWEERYRALAPTRDLFETLKRLRFLGLLARSGVRPDDLQAQARSYLGALRASLPPEILGPVQRETEKWFGQNDPLPAELLPASARSLSALGEESREGVSMILQVAKRLTGGESPEGLLRAVLESMMRLSALPRAGILLRRDGGLQASLFLGREWEEQTDLPLELSRSIARAAVEEGKRIVVRDARVEEPAGRFGESLKAHALRGVICLPLRARGEIIGAVYLDDPERPVEFSDSALGLLEGMADLAAGAVHTSLMVAELRKERERLDRLNRELLELTVRRSRPKIRWRGGGEESAWEDLGLFGESPAFRALLAEIRAVAQAPSPVLVVGETGTEKEAVVRALAAMGGRGDKPLVAVDCAAVPEEVFEAELFGYEKGAFTGAESAQAGLIRSAQDGTVLFDMLDALPLALQPILLRVLQEYRVRPLGSTVEYPINCRFVATSTREPEELVAEGLLREDLYYRIGLLKIRVPPLRERMEDLREFVRRLLKRSAEREGRPPGRITRAALRRLEAHRWPGNILELANELSRASLACRGGVIDVGDLSPVFSEAQIRGLPLPKRRKEGFRRMRGQLEQRILQRAIREAGGSHVLAAAQLGISLSTLYRKMRNAGRE